MAKRLNINFRQTHKARSATNSYQAYSFTRRIKTYLTKPLEAIKRRKGRNPRGFDS